MQRSIVISLVAAVVFGVAVGLGAYTFLYAKGYSYLTNNPAAWALPRHAGAARPPGSSARAATIPWGTPKRLPQA